jgi:hypothetical protein
LYNQGASTDIQCKGLILGLGEDTLGSGADKALFVIGAFIASAAWQLVLAGPCWPPDCSEMC